MTADSLAASGVLAADQMERAFQRERARVERNEQCFSLAVFRMPAGKTNGTVREMVAKTAQVLMNRIRTYDDVGLVDDHSLAVLLPETSGAATWTFVDGALEDLNTHGLTAACEVYTYPHPDSREEPRSEGEESGVDGDPAYREYGRVDHPQDHDATPQDAGSSSTSGEIENHSDTHSGRPSVRQAEPALSNGSASHQHKSENMRSHGTGSLKAALNGTAVMERPALRAIKDGHHSPVQANHRDLHSVSVESVAMSAGSSALASVRSPRPDAVPASTPIEWSQRAKPATEQPVAGQIAETRQVRDLAPYFEERLPLYRRTVDILVAGSALALLSPVLITGAILVKVTSPGPIIFAQPRAGRGGRPFQFYKLRSMYRDAEDRKNALRLVNEKDGPIFKIKNDPRITPVGKVIRKFSIDELPQLFNVLKGDMTLVGPRPPVLDEVKEYETWQRQRLDITGGITCIWQVSGRSEVTFREWMRMDVRYRKQRSLGLDLKLIWKTFGAVFSGKGAY